MSKHIGSAIEAFGSQQVLGNFDLYCTNRDSVYYSVWQSGVPKFTYTGGDLIEGRELLERNLNAWAANGNTATYQIRYHPALDKNNDITNNSPFGSSCNFKMKDPSIMPYQGQQVGNAPGPTIVVPEPSSEKLDMLIDLVRQQNERLTAMEEDVYGDDDEDPEDMEDDEPEPDAFDTAISGISKMETAVQQSPMLSQVYNDLRLLLRVGARKLGIDPNEFSNNNRNEPQTMAGTTQQAPPPGSIDFGVVFKELIKEGNFPELPAMLVKLHQVMKEDRDTFDLARKKLIDGVNKL